MTKNEPPAGDGRFAWPEFGGAVCVPAAMRRPGAAQAAQKEYDGGYDAGHAAGLAAAAAEIKTLKERLVASVRAVEQTRTKIDAEQQARLTELAHAVCSKILDIELTTDRRVFDAFVHAGIAHLDASAATVRVHVNPTDHPLFEPPLDGIVVEADATVPEGGCSIRTDERRVDYDPYGLLDQVFEELRRG
jgi:flagellar biosynthesis/type III secretory pathway protein FliH